MSWIQKLYETYENNSSQIGVENSESSLPLLPVAHLQTSTHIEVTLNAKGDFQRASLLSSKEPKTIIPCTEASAGRSGKFPKAHPLSDKLQYVAGDYEKYGGSKWFAYEDFMAQLQNWVEFDINNKKLAVIYDYLRKGTLIEDLVTHKIITLDNQGKMENKWDKKIYPDAPSISQEDSIVRWRVEIEGDLEPSIWKDPKMYSSWQDFFMQQQTQKGFCHVLGKEAVLCFNHPKNIYSRTANAKLISSNDEEAFRGRFSEAVQAGSVSYEVSQKAHNALKWLISKQGYANGSKVILCWGTNDTNIPDIMEDSLGFLDDIEEAAEESYTAEEMAQDVKKRIMGYKGKQNFDFNDRVIIMGMEAATDGRLSITYYQELQVKDFVDHLEKWHTSCYWLHEYRNKKFIGAPSLMDITEAIYGDSEHVDINIKMSTIQRMLPCIVENQKIPFDIVLNVLRMAIKRISYETKLHDEKNKEKLNKVLSVACSIYNKYSYDYMGEGYLVALDEQRSTRDYLYGRLLAVAQNVEQWALSEANENRMTNADRMMHRFSEHPFSTWKNLEISLKPYFARLKEKGISREKLIDEIMVLFDPEDFIKDTKLSGEFLLGYHCQRQELKKKKIIKESNEKILVHN